MFNLVYVVTDDAESVIARVFSSEQKAVQYIEEMFINFHGGKEKMSPGHKDRDTYSGAVSIQRFPHKDNDRVQYSIYEVELDAE